VIGSVIDALFEPNMLAEYPICDDVGVYVADGTVIGPLVVNPLANVVTVPAPPILIGFAVAPDPVPMLIVPPVVLDPVPIFNTPDVCVVEIPTVIVSPDALNDGDTTEVPVITPADVIDPLVVEIVPEDAVIFPVVAVIPVPAVIVVPAESVVFADTEPAEAVIFPEVAVIPPDADVIPNVDNVPLIFVVYVPLPIFTVFTVGTV
jgi:hypothetical protein